MTPRRESIDPDLVSRVRSKVLRAYEGMKQTLDSSEFGIVVSLALSDEEVESLVRLALEEAKGPISWRELKQVFAGIVGEDRLRRILANLKARDEIVELTRTRYVLPQYLPETELSKVKNPRVLSKIMRSN